MPRARFARLALSVGSLAIATSCVMDRAPAGLRETPSGPGATVRFDLAHAPLPDMPFPNDVATWPDPTSRTGLRVNASLVAPTGVERNARERLSRLEGWGTFSPISVSFDVDANDPAYAGPGAAIDLDALTRRHVGDDYDFADDAIYLVNLTTGIPVALDVGAGNFNDTLASVAGAWPNDPRARERNFVFETIDETKGGAITNATFTPADDTDHDGVLDQPNLDDPSACSASDPSVRDQCIADHLLVAYERETDTLIVRPLLPLTEMTRYAVVITDRLRDRAGNAVKSPFDHVYHAAMQSTARRVMDVIDDPKLAAYFGDITGTGLDHVAFTWSFTTQPTVDDLRILRDGLYGKGPFARWADAFPPRLELGRAVGLVPHVLDGTATDPPGWQNSDAAKAAGCDAKLGNLYVVRYAELRARMKAVLVQLFGYDEGPPLEALLTSLDAIDHIVIATYASPFLLEGGPRGTNPEASFDLDFTTAEGVEASDTVETWLVVPKATGAFKQPFDVAIFGHGTTRDVSELLVYAGHMAQHGLATVGINAAGHGLALDGTTAQSLATLLGSGCFGPFFDAVTQSRARDLDGDGVADSGGDFWSSYLLHTRDGIRQTVLDEMQLVRILRAFGTPSGKMLCRTEASGWSKPATSACDVNGDGKIEIAGDFDGDGVADVGGPNAKYGAWGESLGGIVAAIHGALDPFVTTAVPVSSGGGLADVNVRASEGPALDGAMLHLLGPLIVSVPASERAACTPSSTERDHCTVCGASEMSLRWVVPDLGREGEVEIGCVDAATFANSTVLVDDVTSGVHRCTSAGDTGRVYVSVPGSAGDAISIAVFAGKDRVESYATCKPTFSADVAPAATIAAWGKGPFASGAQNEARTSTCGAPTCVRFQGRFFGEGSALVAPADGLGAIRQTPALRRLLQLAQTAIDPGDPVSFAPLYLVAPARDPEGATIARHGLLALDTIGDASVPTSAGIAFARAAGVLPFLRPDQLDRFPAYADYVAPSTLYRLFGNKTPNEALIEDHVVEGVAELARYPAAASCTASQNARPAGTTFVLPDGSSGQCLPSGCASAGVACWRGSHCDATTDACVSDPLGDAVCEDALFDADDLDERDAGYFEVNAANPLRLARYAEPVNPAAIAATWQPRILGQPFGGDLAWTPTTRPLAALLDAYVAPGGAHAFAEGDPCRSFDAATYLTNLTARFLMTSGRDLYYLSHPATHRCLEDASKCGYLE